MENQNNEENSIDNNENDIEEILVNQNNEENDIDDNENDIEELLDNDREKNLLTSMIEDKAKSNIDNV